jgi:hypothetical protein
MGSVGASEVKTLALSQRVAVRGWPGLTSKMPVFPVLMLQPYRAWRTRMV